MADDEQQPIDPRAEQLGTETPEPVAEAPPPSPEPEPKKEERTDWRILELGQTRRQLEEERAARERVEAENRRLTELAQATMRRDGQTAEPSPSQPVPINNADLERQVELRVQERIVNDRAGQLDAALQRDFAEDYSAIIDNFRNIQNSMRLMFDDIVATGEGAYVAATIGKDPNRIQKLRDMPEAQRRMALLKVALEKPTATPETPKVETTRPSAAPPPPAPAPSGGAPPVGHGTNLYDERFNFTSYYNGDIAREIEADNRWNAERKRQKMNSVGRMWSPLQNR